MVPGRTELAPDTDAFHYVAAIDAAFKGDQFTLAVAHQDRDREMVVVDLLAGWQGSKKVPLRPSAVIPQIKEICERYGIYQILGDQYGAEPLKDQFTRNSLHFEERTFTNQSKADVYATLRSRVMDGSIELLDHDQSVKEIRGLEVESLPGGSIRVGHGRSSRGRDDFADAIALAVSECSQYVEAASAMLGEDLDSIRLMADYSCLPSQRPSIWDRF